MESVDDDPNASPNVSVIETLQTQNRELRQQIIDANRHAIEIQKAQLTPTNTVSTVMAKELTSASVRTIRAGTEAAIATLRVLREGPAKYYDHYVNQVEAEMETSATRFKEATPKEPATDSSSDSNPNPNPRKSSTLPRTRM